MNHTIRKTAKNYIQVVFMSNVNFQVGFELKELKVGEIATFRIN